MVLLGEYKREFKKLLKIAWPIAGTSMLQYSTLFVSLIFCGQISKQTLNGAALASSVVNVTGNAVMLGLSSACDTLFSQTYGSVNKKRMGVIVQRSLLILLLGCIPIFAIYLNTGHLMRALGQNEEVSRLGGMYATIYIAGLPGIAVSDVIAKFLQSQSVVLPSLIINVIVNILNAALHALFMLVIPLGIQGAAIAVSLTQWSVVFFHIPYIVCSGIYKTTWAGFSLECLVDWGEFLELAFSGMIMFALECWSFEVITFVAGYLGVTPLAAHTINFTVACLIHMIPLGVGIASAVTVGQNLGEQNPVAAKIAARVAIGISVILGVVTAAIILGLKDVIPRIFSSDPDVISYGSSIMLLLSLFELLDYTKCITGGIIRGIGHQRFGAYINLIGYYIIALPLGISLMFLTYLEIAGAWWGLCLSAVFQSVSFIIRIATCNWDRETEMAQIRAGVKSKDKSNYNSIEGVEEIELESKKINKELLSDDRDKPVNYRYIIIKRLLILLFCILILVAGIIIRLYLDGLQ